MDAAPDIDAGVDAGLRDASVMDALPSDAGPPAGHAVLLGFFYQNASTEADAVLARAVLLSERSGPIDVLEYTEYLGFPTIPERIHPLIDAAATAVARSVTFTSFDNHARLGSLLPFADALLVYDVTSAPTAMTIDVIAGAWRDDLIAFLADGGVVIVMDFSGTYDKRTYRVLEGPELMRFGGATRVDGVPLEPTADPLAAGLAPFPAPNQTTIYPLSGGGSAVIQRRDSLEPVVRHLIR